MLPFLLCSLVLNVAEIAIGDQRLNVEIADTPKARSTGLQGREELSKGNGMLFVFEKPDILSFWMKDTLIPLSIGFFDETKTLINIEEMHPLKELHDRPAIFQSHADALYALEVPLNWFEQNNIQAGASFQFVDKTPP